MYMGNGLAFVNANADNLLNEQASDHDKTHNECR